MSFSLECMFLVFVLSGFLHSAESIHCYQCGDSSKEGPCVTDTAQMKAEYQRYNDTTTTSDGPQAPFQYLKDCSGTGLDACVIERIEEMGQMHAYIRDCSNGRNFSLPEIPQFGNIDASLNHTLCVYKASSKILACVTLCRTDFCNGPQIESGFKVSFSHLWFYISLIVVLYNTIF